MENESLERQSKGYARFPVKGMESVVATVSGYHGSERFNLIKLIASAGASYVGNMNQSITHLVCWKFEGGKYEIAKKFKTVIVNHRWIEECVKKGRRVSETPYTLQSGQDVGTLCSDISLRINQASVRPKVRETSKEPLLDVEDEEASDDTWAGFTVLNEYNHGSIRPNGNRKTNEKISRKDHSGSSRCNLEAVNFEPMVMEKKRITSSEPRCKGRRLIKKQLTMVDLVSTSKLEQECQVVKVFPENNISEISSNSSNVERHQNASKGHPSDVRCPRRGQSNNDSVDSEDIEAVNDENEKNYVSDAPLLLETPEEHCEVLHEDYIEAHRGNRQPMSAELSCVICWTDFSTTRGVLTCGHRFCFSCIQNWADQLASKKKPSTCPLCKAGFICITKVEDAVSSDQKIYSQTIPNDNLKNDVYIVPDESNHLPNNPSGHVCFRCSSREPVDLLVRCQYCQIRCVHSYCLDPPLFPWICFQCKDLQMLYLHNR